MTIPRHSLVGMVYAAKVKRVTCLRCGSSNSLECEGWCGLERRLRRQRFWDRTGSAQRIIGS